MNITYSLIMVNYHSENEIAACLNSLDSVHSAGDYEVIIVSNSPVSEDDKATVDTVTSHCRWIQMEENIGYGRACNAGASVSSGDYILFLNPDIKFINDILPILEKQVNAYNQKAAAGPATFNSNLERVPSVKNELTFLWMIQWLCPPFSMVSNKSGSHDPTLYDKTTEVDIVNGSAIFMHRSAFDSTGGFSDDYFMYWEENDFCLTLKNHGYQILYVPEAKIIHDSGHSTNKIFLPMEIEKHRSQKIYVKKHHPNLAKINRLAGILAYSWRLLGSLVLFRTDKMNQFRTLFMWYLVRYQ